jgi:hypothetical protein
MFKRMSLCLLSICLLVSALPATGEVLERETSTWVERVWERVSTWFGLRGPDALPPSGFWEDPQSLSAADDGSGHVDPNG